MTAPTAAAILEQLSPKDAQVLNLLALCRTPEYLHVWKEGPELLRRFARLLLKQGHPTLALEVAARGLDEKPIPTTTTCSTAAPSPWSTAATPPAPSCSSGSSLERTDLPLAIRSDALSLAGRIRKDLAARAHRPGRPDPPGSAKPSGFYKQAFDLSGDTFPGINAATLALLVGEPERSRASPPGSATASSPNSTSPAKDRDYWLLATLGEAYLLLGDDTAAKGRYAQAVRLARDGAQRRRHRLDAPAAPPAPRAPADRRRPAGPVPSRSRGRLRRPRPSTGPATRSASPPTPPWKPPSAAPSSTNWTPWRPTSATAAPAAAATSSSAS